MRGLKTFREWLDDLVDMALEAGFMVLALAFAILIVCAYGVRP